MDVEGKFGLECREGTAEAGEPPALGGAGQEGQRLGVSGSSWQPEETPKGVGELKLPFPPIGGALSNPLPQVYQVYVAVLVPHLSVYTLPDN